MFWFTTPCPLASWLTDNDNNTWERPPQHPKISAIRVVFVLCGRNHRYLVSRSSMIVPEGCSLCITIQLLAAVPMVERKKKTRRVIFKRCTPAHAWLRPRGAVRTETPKTFPNRTSSSALSLAAVALLCTERHKEEHRFEKV